MPRYATDLTGRVFGALSVISRQSNDRNGIEVKLESAWSPTRATIQYGRQFHVIRLEDDDGHASVVRRRFRSRRLVRTWAKRTGNWKWTVFSDVVYRPPQPIQHIKLDIVVSRTD